jgi:hypothetical protein
VAAGEGEGEEKEKEPLRVDSALVERRPVGEAAGGRGRGGAAREGGSGGGGSGGGALSEIILDTLITKRIYYLERPDKYYARG